jgi:hypothetical protein
MWPSPRAQRVAKELEMRGRIQKPKGKGRWSYVDAVDALAVYAGKEPMNHLAMSMKDVDTFLQIDPVDYIIRYLGPMEVKRILPKDVWLGYSGPMRKLHPWIWNHQF